MKKVIITTANAGKLEAAHNAFRDHASQIDEEFHLVSLSVESGVRDTPLSDHEGLVGCAKRIENAKHQDPSAELYVALEGVLAQVDRRWYVRGWTMVEDVARDRIATASGAAVEVPTAVEPFIASGEQFSQRIKEIYAVTPKEASVVREIGANGVFSNGAYSRLNTFYDGISICLAYIGNDRNWTS